eukprot:COSAG02_NODE_1694_length_11277_cov_36.084855_8_plen_1845_part_00
MRVPTPRPGAGPSPPELFCVRDDYRLLIMSSMIGWAGQGWAALWRLVVALCLAAALCLADDGGGAVQQQQQSYVSEVLLPAVVRSLRDVMEEPWRSIRFLATEVELGFLDHRNTEAIRQTIYNQVVALQVGDRFQTSIDMMYCGMVDGRFEGYFSPTSYTSRGAGDGRPSLLSWEPYSLDTVNSICAPSNPNCRGETGRYVNETCPAGDTRQSGVCAPTAAVDEATCRATMSGAVWYAPCTTAGCCDRSIRNYYATSTEVSGRPLEFKRWRTYDPRVRGWYQQLQLAWLSNGTRAVFSSMYEFATSQALGISATAAMLNTQNELVGVYAVDYDVGTLSAVVNRSITASMEHIARAWTFAVERDNGKLVAISTGDKLYDKQAMIDRGVSFSDSRLNAVDASHASIREVARMLAADNWPADVFSRMPVQEPASNTDGFEFYTAAITVRGLDWLVVAGIDVRCQRNEVWDSEAGRCKACRGGQQPQGPSCQPCPRGHAGVDGLCERCLDGTHPVGTRTECIACPAGFAGTQGHCTACNAGGQVASQDRKSCVCKSGTYDSWCSLDSARLAIGSGATCVASETRPAQPLHVFVWPHGGRTWSHEPGRFGGDDINLEWTMADVPELAVATTANGCPCLAWPWAGSSDFLSQESGMLDVELDGTVYHYPQAYGMDSCAAHDNIRQPYCADEQGNPLPDSPSFCDSHWCFVDANNCDVASDPSSYFMGSRPTLHYSYEACSSVNEFACTDFDEQCAEASAETDRDRCIQCPRDGVDCTDGVARPLAGFTEVEDASSLRFDQHFFACTEPEYCVGISEHGRNSSRIGSCIANHDGVLCASCLPGYGLSDNNAQCSMCTDITVGQVVLVCAGVLGSFVLMLLAVRQWMKVEHRRDVIRCGLQPLRITISYLQVASQIGQVLNFRYPGWWEDVIGALRYWMEPWRLLFRLLKPAACMEVFGVGLGGFHSRWVLNVVALPTVSVLIITLVKLIVDRRIDFKNDAQTHIDLRGALFMILFFVYPLMMSTSIAAWVCTPLDGPSGDRTLLDADDLVFCKDAAHVVFQSLSVLIILIVGLLVPMGLGWHLIMTSRKHAASIHALRIKELADALSTREQRISSEDVRQVAAHLNIEGFSFLITCYKTNQVYWESVEMVKKLSLVGLVLVVGRGSTAQLVVALALSIFFLMLHMRYLPHKDYFDNCYKAAADVHILIVLVVAIVLKSGTSRALNNEPLSPIFYEQFLTASFVVLLLLGYPACTLCKIRELRAVKERWRFKQHGATHHVQASCCIAELAADSRRVTPELGRAFDLYRCGAAVGDGERQELNFLLSSYLGGWQFGKRYAAFLSHYKEEGGTVASLLHEALVRSLPGVHESQVFLDSNNLRNLRQLEEHVVDSEVLILLLTKKVLSRPMCLLELYTAAQHKVPIIVLRCEGPGGGKADQIPEALKDIPAHLRHHGSAECVDKSDNINLGSLQISAADLSQVLRGALMGLNWRKRILSFSSHASGKLRDGQAVVIAKEMVQHTGDETDRKTNSIVQENAALSVELLSISEATKTEMGLDPEQKLCIVHSEQADDEAVRLRHELIERTDLKEGQIYLRGEVEGGQDALFQKVVVVLMLQTRNVLREIHCISLLYKALDRNIPLITINLVTDHPSIDKTPQLQEMQYNYRESANLMKHLSLLALPEGKLEDVCALEHGSHSIQKIQDTLSNNIPDIISTNILAAAGGHETGSGAMEYKMQIAEVVRRLEVVCKGTVDGARIRSSAGEDSDSAEPCTEQPDVEEGESLKAVKDLPVSSVEEEKEPGAVEPEPEPEPAYPQAKPKKKPVSKEHLERLATIRVRAQAAKRKQKQDDGND